MSSSDEIDTAIKPRETIEPRTFLEASPEPLLSNTSSVNRTEVEPEHKAIVETIKAASASEAEFDYAGLLFATVRYLIKELLKTPSKDADIAAALNVTSSQAKVWLQRLVDEGVIEKQKKPAGYVTKQSGLFK